MVLDRFDCGVRSRLERVLLNSWVGATTLLSECYNEQRKRVFRQPSPRSCSPSRVSISQLVSQPVSQSRGCGLASHSFVFSFCLSPG
eukprot:1187845-Prorocentrum_minimum.AAC.12